MMIIPISINSAVGPPRIRPRVIISPRNKTRIPPMLVTVTPLARMPPAMSQRESGVTR